MPEIVTLSRYEAERYRPGPGEVVVSIHSPGESPATLSEAFVARLTLAFADTDDPGDRDGFGPDAAARIARFVAAHQDARRVVVHCALGLSRSVGVAEALVAQGVGPYLWAEGVPRHPGTRPHANRMVWRRLEAALTALPRPRAG